MTVVTASVPYWQGIGIGTERNSPTPFSFLPDSDDTVATHMGVYFCGVQPLQVADNHIVGKLLVACRLRMLVESFSYFFTIYHNNLSLNQDYRNHSFILSGLTEFHYLLAVEVATHLKVLEGIITGSGRREEYHPSLWRMTGAPGDNLRVVVLDENV